MVKTSKVVSIVLILIMIAPVLLSSVAFAEYVQQIYTKRISEEANAIQALQNGEIQGWLYELSSPDLANQLEQQGFKIYGSFSIMHNFLINPATCSDGTLNIFTNQKARFALQFLLPRNEIVANIYKGYAIPLVTPWVPQHPDYPNIVATAMKIEAVIANNGEDYGYQLLEQALQELGAVKGDDGKWYYNDQPVTVKMAIRVQDERKEIGDILANKLEAAGITVERNYVQSAGIAYGTDPFACEWQIYTEGWLYTGMSKYDYTMFTFFYSSIYGWNAPWGDYKNETIDEIALRLAKGNYTDLNEFWQLINEGVWLGFHESTRVFGFVKEALYVASPDLQGIVTSPVASPWNEFTYLGLQYTKGDTVNLANVYVYWEGATTWNPVDGFGDAYSSQGFLNAITFNFGPQSRLTDGETGWTPGNLTSWEILGVLSEPIPADAIVYDTVNHKLTTAEAAGATGGNYTAVLINYKILPQIKFHDGSQMTVADLLPFLAIMFEWATNTTTADNPDPWYFQGFADNYAIAISIYKAVKVVNDTAIIVYIDYSSIDPGDIAGVANFWSSWPLELMAGMDLLVRNGGYAWNLQDATEDIKPVHLVDPDQVAQIVQLLQEARDNPPYWVQDLIDLGLLTLEE